MAREGQRHRKGVIGGGWAAALEHMRVSSTGWGTMGRPSPQNAECRRGRRRALPEADGFRPAAFSSPPRSCSVYKAPAKIQGYIVCVIIQ